MQQFYIHHGLHHLMWFPEMKTRNASHSLQQSVVCDLWLLYVGTPRILNIDLLGSNWLAEQKPGSSWNEDMDNALCLNLQSTMSQPLRGAKIQILTFLLWEHLLYTNFVVHIICVIYKVFALIPNWWTGMGGEMWWSWYRKWLRYMRLLQTTSETWSMTSVGGFPPPPPSTKCGPALCTLFYQSICSVLHKGVCRCSYVGLWS